MNSSYDESEQHNPPEPTDPDDVALLWVALVHCCCVAVLGTIGNAMALWCVGTCTKTRRPVKVLLFSVFVPALLICLGTRPQLGELLLSRIKVRPLRFSDTVSKITMVVYNTLVQTEYISTAALATVRALSVWAPQRPSLGLRGTAVLVFAIFMYSTLAGLGLLGLLAMGEREEPWTVTLIIVIPFINTALPALITGAACVFIIYAIQRNKRRLAASRHQPREATSMDPATRTMLAVFISNVIFSVPHSILYLMGRQPPYMGDILRVIFSTHFVVDPLAFVWLNSGYRRHISSRVRNVTRSISSPPTLSFLSAGSASRSDQYQLSTHKQEGVKFSPHAADAVET